MIALSPVPVPDLIDLWSVVTPRKAPWVDAVILQVARSDSIGWTKDGKLVAAALLYPVDAGSAELVFACRPLEPQAAVLLVRAVLRAARLSVRQLSAVGSFRVVARVRLGHCPGSRLASLAGLRPTGISGNFEIWERSWK
ncbi:hypothetical protein [Blastochloris tepida]|uniref:hypothetical protein n=1 Tax=Blastochloris tepida TaxID=2233851 RepID=UPI000F827BBC|nr:hypothetical protein [Blastochloris tepida]